MAKAPLVSVLMPVRDAEATVEQAIRSILGQSLDDLELVLVDDGSSDGSARIAKAFKDPRVRVIRQRALGQLAARNRGLKACRGEFIAMADADDISEPERLRLQVEALRRCPELDGVSSDMRFFGGLSGTRLFPRHPDEVAAEMIFAVGMAQPAAMFRKEALKDGYPEGYPCSQDHALFSKLCLEGKRFAVLPRLLLRYRIHEGQISRSKKKLQQRLGDKVRLMWLRRLGLDPGAQEWALHRSAASLTPWALGERGLLDLKAWFLRLQNANDERRLFEAWALRRVLGRRWLSACWANRSLGWRVWPLYCSAPWAGHGAGLLLRKRILR